VDKDKPIEESDLTKKFGAEKAKKITVDALKGAECCYKFGYPCKYAFKGSQFPKTVYCEKGLGYSIRNLSECPIDRW
jgi:hypothetical protein